MTIMKTEEDGKEDGRLRQRARTSSLGTEMRQAISSVVLRLVLLRRAFEWRKMLKVSIDLQNNDSNIFPVIWLSRNCLVKLKWLVKYIFPRTRNTRNGEIRTKSSERKQDRRNWIWNSRQTWTKANEVTRLRYEIWTTTERGTMKTTTTTKNWKRKHVLP